MLNGSYISWQLALGYLIIIITVWCFTPWFRKFSSRLLKIFYLAFIVLSVIIYTRFFLWRVNAINIVDQCSYCLLYQQCFNRPAIYWKIGVELPNFVFQYSRWVFPAFIVGSLIAALFFDKHPRRLPMNLFTAVAAGVSLPLCACGVFPIAKGMMANRNIKGHVILTFLFITPMLSPYTIYLSYTLLGQAYLVLRLLSIVLLALAGSFIISSLPSFKLVRQRQIKTDTSAYNQFAKSLTDGQQVRLLDKGFYFFKSMFKFVLAGIVIGSILSVFLPPQLIDRYIINTPFGLFITAFAALPINMCSGQEIVILKSLRALGLTMGHQIAFTIAATGFCLSVIPLYYILFGKRLTIIIACFFLIGTVTAGYLINLITRLI